MEDISMETIGISALFCVLTFLPVIFSILLYAYVLYSLSVVVITTAVMLWVMYLLETGDKLEEHYEYIQTTTSIISYPTWTTYVIFAVELSCLLINGYYILAAMHSTNRAGEDFLLTYLADNLKSYASG